MRNDRVAREHDHEGEQIERERNHPEQRHCGDVGRNVRGHRDQKARRHGREEDPAHDVAPGRRRFFRRARLRRGGGRCRRRLVGRLPQQIAAAGDQQDENDESRRPYPGLRGERDERFDQDRIRQQREEAADVAGGVEEVRIARRRMIGAREPCLQQRRVGGEREKGQPDGYREQAEQPQRFAFHRGPSPACRDRQRQPEAGDHQQAEMDHDRAAAGRVARQQMRVAVSCQQRGLEEHHGHRPHARCATESRQHQFGEHRLHCEQQGRTQEDGRGEDHQKLGHPRGLILGGRGRRNVRIGHHDGSLIRRGAGAGKPGIVVSAGCWYCDAPAPVVSYSIPAAQAGLRSK